MAQQERKIKKVLDAAVRFAHADRTNFQTASEVIEHLTTAVAEYEAVKTTEPPADPGGFLCPHCEAPRPSYGWHFNMGDTGPFALQWLTCFCGECKKAIAVTVVAFLPKDELVQTLKQQFGSRMSQA